MEFDARNSLQLTKMVFQWRLTRRNLGIVGSPIKYLQYGEEPENCSACVSSTLRLQVNTKTDMLMEGSEADADNIQLYITSQSINNFPEDMLAEK
jgi:hypothetical protein